MHLIAVFALFMVSAVAHADEQVAIYIEHEGKAIELASDAVSPIDEGTGPIVYAAFEADDLVTPANVDTVGKTLRVIGWRRAGDRIVIYRAKTETVEYPVSAMKFRFVERLDMNEPSDDEHPACCEKRQYPAAS